MKPTDLARFWSFAPTANAGLNTDDCWTWRGPFTRGVPRFTAGEVNYSPKRWITGELTGSLPPKGHGLNHQLPSCQKHCVNPHHGFLDGQIVRKDPVVLFWEKVDKTSTPDGCWLWTGADSNDRYGRFKLGAENRNAHVASYILHTGKEVPPGYYVCHTCDVEKCVRPEHLYLGTPKDNAQDKLRRGRCRGPRAPLLNQEQAREVRVLAPTTPVQDLAERFGVAPKIIRNLLSGLTYQWVTDENPTGNSENPR